MEAEQVQGNGGEAPQGESPRRADRLRGLLARAGLLVVAGAVGAGIAVGIGSAVGLGGETTTVVSQATGVEAQAGTEPAAPAEPPTFRTEDGGLTVAEIYERSAPGVVRVTSVGTVAAVDPLDPFSQPVPFEQPLGTGSGFVIDEAGHIVTNYHVVQDAEEVEVTFSGGESVRAKVVGVDPSTDLAVLDVDLPTRALTPLPLGNSDTVQVGDEVVAIGNPFGLDRTVTKGIVSALQRRITAPNGFTIEKAIQTDAAINRGNSGGPLINARGEVIGVNAQIETGGVSQGNVGVGFAIPVNTVKEIAAQLIETGKVERAFLGIEMQEITPELAESFRLPVDEGVLVAAVREGSPADRAGLRGGDTQVIVNGESYVLGGDVITAVDGADVTSPDELREIILSKRPGDTVELEVHREDSTLTVQVALGRQPPTPAG